MRLCVCVCVCRLNRCSVSFGTSNKCLRIENETDTVANLLRCALLDHPAVEDAAFSRAHPTDDHFQLYINARRGGAEDGVARGDGGQLGAEPADTNGGSRRDEGKGDVAEETNVQTKIETLTVVIEAISATLAKLGSVATQYAVLDSLAPTPFYSYRDA